MQEQTCNVIVFWGLGIMTVEGSVECTTQKIAVLWVYWQRKHPLPYKCTNHQAWNRHAQEIPMSVHVNSFPMFRSCRVTSLSSLYWPVLVTDVRPYLRNFVDISSWHISDSPVKSLQQQKHMGRCEALNYSDYIRTSWPWELEIMYFFTKVKVKISLLIWNFPFCWRE